MLRNFVILFLMIAFAITLLFIFQKREKEQRLQHEQQRQAEEKLQAANEKLEQYVNNIREKNALIEKFEATLLQQQALDNEVLETAIVINENNINLLHQSMIMTGDDWAAFKQLFEQVWPGFFQRVNQKYPGLTESEERVLALCKLNLESKDMAGMIGISVDSLRKSRYRLRKKFPLILQDQEFKEVI